MTAFGPTAINYFENRADGGFAWTVAYDLSLLNNESLTTLRVDLVGDDPGATADVWRDGANAIWNNKAFFSDGTRLYEIKFDLQFVDSGAHHTVNVRAGTGGTNMNNWYLTNPSGWPDHMHDEIAAHETGHMFGNFDEYAGGATYGGFTTTGTLMSDLTLAGFERYFWTQEHYTEVFGGMTLSTVRGRTGTAAADVMTGSAGMDGFYALAGNDTISAGNGNDLLDGGAGTDRMTGGSGADIFDLDFVSETGNSSATRDIVTDFARLVDDFDLSGMDASAVLAGNNAFAWRSTLAFTAGAAGQLRYQKVDAAGTANDKTIVYGDTDNDTLSEFQIELTGLVTLRGVDFIA
jgi:Ca2+-binding RTX toxin-like protein